MKLNIIGDTESKALFTTMENGLTAESVNVAIGASADNTINPKASAPPNKPNLHNMRTNGATMRENPTPNAASMMFGSKNNRTTEIPPKTIQIKSEISRLRISIIVAIPSIAKANKILICKMSNSIMCYFPSDHFFN